MSYPYYVLFDGIITKKSSDKRFIMGHDGIWQFSDDDDFKHYVDSNIYLTELAAVKALIAQKTDQRLVIEFEIDNLMRQYGYLASQRGI